MRASLQENNREGVAEEPVQSDYVDDDEEEGMREEGSSDDDRGLQEAMSTLVTAAEEVLRVTWRCSMGGK